MVTWDVVGTAVQAVSSIQTIGAVDTVSSIDFGSGVVAVGVLCLPVPEIAAHSFQVMRGLEARFLLRQSGIRSQVGYITPSK